MAWTQKEDAYLRKCMKDGIKMTEAARVLGKGYESVVKRRQMLLAGSYDAITYNPRVEVTPCSDSSLIIEMVEWLFDLGYGTPIGGTRDGAARFLIGRHALVPFAYPGDLGAVCEYAQSFVLDNSAFTHWKKGGNVDVPDYHAWVDSVALHPCLDWVLIPDKIDGTESENVEMVTTWLRMGCRAKSVPVWHLHESLDWLDYLVTHFQTVALGSSGKWATPGTDAWWVRMADAMKTICDDGGRPRCKLHGLRMLDPAIFQHLPLASADSTNAAVNGGAVSRFGMYPAPTSAQRSAVIADRIEQYNSASHWVSPPIQQCLFEGAA